MSWYNPWSWFKREKRFNFDLEANAEAAIASGRKKLLLRKLRMLENAMLTDKDVETAVYAKQLQGMGQMVPDRASDVGRLIQRIEEKAGG